MSKFQAYCEGFRGRREVQHPREEFTTRGDYEAHMSQVHGRKVTRTRKPSMWKAPGRKAFEPHGVTLGTRVVGAGRHLPWHSLTQGIEGQVWSKAPGGRMWWVVTDGGIPYAMHEASMTVLGQCGEVTAPLFDELAG